MGALPVGRHGLRARLTDLALAGRNEERSIGLSGNRRGRPGVLRFEQSIPREGESNAHPEFGTWTSWEPLPRRPRASTRRERGGAGPPGACLPDAAVAGRRRRERVPTDLALCAGWSLPASISRGRRKPARRSGGYNERTAGRRANPGGELAVTTASSSPRPNSSGRFISQTTGTTTTVKHFSRRLTPMPPAAAPIELTEPD
jgi:hypothetical protein